MKLWLVFLSVALVVLSRGSVETLDDDDGFLTPQAPVMVPSTASTGDVLVQGWDTDAADDQDADSDGNDDEPVAADEDGDDDDEEEASAGDSEEQGSEREEEESAQGEEDEENSESMLLQGDEDEDEDKDKDSDDSDRSAPAENDSEDDDADEDDASLEAMINTASTESAERPRRWSRRVRPVRRARVVRKPDPTIFTPEPKDKVLPKDVFAVPNPPPVKKPKKVDDFLSRDTLKDPLPYADKYARFKKVVDESDFAPEKDPKEFVPEPQFDPVSDPLLKQEGTTIPNSSRVAFSLHNPVDAKELNLFNNVVPDGSSPLPLKHAGRNSVAEHDQTWQSGEFRGKRRVYN